jgi:periplasmic copper chaperone A
VKKTSTLSLAVLLALAGCSGSEAAGSPAPQEAAALTVSDPWTKAADTGMTAAFATLTNDSDTDVRIVSAASDVTSSMELHEMFTDDAGVMAMRQKDGGFTVEAGGSHELSPGGDHLMFMDLTTPVLPGDEVVVTLTAEDGSTLEFTAPGRSYAGANESYHADSEMAMP